MFIPPFSLVISELVTFDYQKKLSQLLSHLIPVIIINFTCYLVIDLIVFPLQ